MSGITVRVLALSMLVLLGAASAQARAAASPDEIATKAIAKMQAIQASAVKSLAKQESKGLTPLRRVAARGGPVEERVIQVNRRAVKIGPIAQSACEKILRERDKALGRIVSTVGRASAAEIDAARTRLRDERDRLHGLIAGRAGDIADNLALAASLDPGDRDEVESLIPDTTAPGCVVEAEEEEEEPGPGDT